MRAIIDIVFKNIYSMVVSERPDLKYMMSDREKLNHLRITLDMFPCYRNILDKISKTCFSLPEVRKAFCQVYNLIITIKNS